MLVSHLGALAGQDRAASPEAVQIPARPPAAQPDRARARESRAVCVLPLQSTQFTPFPADREEVVTFISLRIKQGAGVRAPSFQLTVCQDTALHLRAEMQLQHSQPPASPCA